MTSQQLITMAVLCMCRQIESMAASAAAQQAAHAEAEQQLIERLKTVEAALSEARESEQFLRVCKFPNCPYMSPDSEKKSASCQCQHVKMCECVRRSLL